MSEKKPRTWRQENIPPVWLGLGMMLCSGLFWLGVEYWLVTPAMTLSADNRYPEMYGPVSYFRPYFSMFCVGLAAVGLVICLANWITRWLSR